MFFSALSHSDCLWLYKIENKSNDGKKRVFQTFSCCSTIRIFHSILSRFIDIFFWMFFSWFRKNKKMLVYLRKLAILRHAFVWNVVFHSQIIPIEHANFSEISSVIFVFFSDVLLYTFHLFLCVAKEKKKMMEIYSLSKRHHWCCFKLTWKSSNCAIYSKQIFV